jgi:Na+-transporting methylmalonyl-CoA/oxaloacetate decarboxylase, beta subunit
MFGNLVREYAVLNVLSETAQNVLANLITIVLGLTVAGYMTDDKFVRTDTLVILALGLETFVFDTERWGDVCKTAETFPAERRLADIPMITAAPISSLLKNR